MYPPPSPPPPTHTTLIGPSHLSKRWLRFTNRLIVFVSSTLAQQKPVVDRITLGDQFAELWLNRGSLSLVRANYDIDTSTLFSKLAQLCDNKMHEHCSARETLPLYHFCKIGIAYEFRFAGQTKKTLCQEGIGFRQTSRLRGLLKWMG